MKRPVILSVIATAAALLLPGEARSHDLYHAESVAPVNFTFPAVRYAHLVKKRVWHARCRCGAKRVRAARVYGAPVVRRSVHVTRTSYRLRRVAYPYAYPPTGYDPLPYRFGPRSAVIVSRYTW